MLQVVRRTGIAIGSFVAAWLAVGLVLGIAFQSTAAPSGWQWAIALIVGAFVYRDILRRERRA